MLDYDNLFEIFSEKNCKILRDEPLSKYTTFKIGGPVDVLVEVPALPQLTEILKYIKINNIPFFVLGNGSNLLVSDAGFRGIIIKLGGDFNKVRLVSKTQIECQCGAPLAKACMLALKNGLSGLEFAWGIPGSCGGAVYMNAGAYNSDMQTVVESSTYVDSDGKINTLTNSQMNFSYRTSIYSGKNNIVTSIILRLTPDSPETIRQRMYDNIKKRKTKQPLEYPNCGSVFKRPANGYAGTLIEQCGLKGKSVGGAMVSTKHAGFIINTGNATCNDVVRLIRIIKQTVFEKAGVNLECEVKTLGDVDL